MGVTAKVLNGIAKSMKSLFDIRAPVFPIKTVFESLPFPGKLQCFTGSRENKFSLLVQSIQKRKIFPFELISKDSDRDKKFCRGFPDPVVRSQPSAREDAVHMNMVIQFLVPGMEDLDDPGLGAKIFLICAQFQKCFCAALMEQAVKEPLIAINQGIEFVGKSKHYMEVRGIYDFRPALIDPDFFKDSLAVGTVPVPAGILVEFHVPAFPARADIDTKSSGFAGKDCMGSFLLFF